MGNSLIQLDTDDHDSYSAIDIIEIVACSLSVSFCSNLLYQTLGNAEKRKILFYFYLGNIAMFTTLLSICELLRLIQEESLNTNLLCNIILFCESYGRNASSLWSFMLSLTLFVTITRPKFIPSLTPTQKQRMFSIPFFFNNLGTLIFGFARLFALNAGIDDKGFFFHDGDSCNNNFLAFEYVYLDLFSHITLPVVLACLSICLSSYSFYVLNSRKDTTELSQHTRRLFLVLLFFPIMNGCIGLLIFITHMYSRFSSNNYIDFLDVLVSSQGWLEFVLFSLRHKIDCQKYIPSCDNFDYWLTFLFCDCCGIKRDKSTRQTESEDQLFSGRPPSTSAAPRARPRLT